MGITQGRRFKTKLSKARGRLAKEKAKPEGEKNQKSLQIYEDEVKLLVKQLNIRLERPQRREALDEKAVIDAGIDAAKPSTRSGKSHGGL